MADFSSGNKRLLNPGALREDAGNYWLGPLTPVLPISPTGERPRQFEYQPGANLMFTPKDEQGISFELLRSFADSWDLLRLVLETRKDQIMRTRFELRPKMQPGETRMDTRRRMAGDKTLLDLHRFWRKPDGFHTFKQWLRMWFEDTNVIDATAIYLQRDTKGRVAQLLPLDGATITRMLTVRGTTPPPDADPPNNVAYQQVLYGYPAFDLTTRDLLYVMKNERTYKRYGFSRVEQILITIGIGLRRQDFQLKYYTDGSVPEALCFLPSDLPIDRVKQVQEWFDSVMSGDLARRRRLTFLPGYGTGDQAKPNVIFPKEVLLKDELDEWLVKIVGFNFGVSVQGLLKQMNRASAETASDTAKEEGLEPDVEFILMVLNMCLEEMGLADEYEFASPQRREVDVLKAAQADNLLTGKIYSVNDVRLARGEEPRPEPEADMLGVFTQMGFVPIGTRPPAQEGKEGGDRPPVDSDPNPKTNNDKNRKVVSI